MNVNRKIKGFGILLVANDGKVVCHICEKRFLDLGKHVLKTHRISVTDYKEMCGLNNSQALISKELSDKRRKSVLQYPELIEQLKVNGKNTLLQKGHRLTKEKRRQWYLSQQNKYDSYSQETLNKYMAWGRKLGKSKRGNEARWKGHVTGYNESIEERIKKTRRLILFERKVEAVLNLCINGERNITDEELYAKYPKDIVDEAIKREIDWATKEGNRLTKNLCKERTERLATGLIPVKKGDNTEQPVTT